MSNNVLNKLCILFFLSLISCQNKNNNQLNNSLEDLENLKKTLIIEIDYISNKDDTFRMIYNKTLFNNQLVDLTINNHITVSKMPQKLTFKMPIKGRPKSISLGLGNEEEKEIIFKKVTLKFEENIFEIYQKDIKKYFTLNKYVSFDSSTNTLITKRINNLHSPVITFKPIVKKHTYR